MEYTLEQLKSMAYDEIMRIESAQQNLKQINIAIGTLLKNKTVPKPAEEIKP